MSRFDEPHDMMMAEPAFGSVVGPVTVRTHREEDCKEPHCVIHKPSDHPLNTAPMIFRADKVGLIERQCEHNVGHPDPDSVWFIENVQFAGEGVGWIGIHGCDGCCNA